MIRILTLAASIAALSLFCGCLTNLAGDNSQDGNSPGFVHGPEFDPNNPRSAALVVWGDFDLTAGVECEIADTRALAIQATCADARIDVSDVQDEYIVDFRQWVIVSSPTPFHEQLAARYRGNDVAVLGGSPGLTVAAIAVGDLLDAYGEADPNDTELRASIELFDGETPIVSAKLTIRLIIYNYDLGPRRRPAAIPVGGITRRTTRADVGLIPRGAVIVYFITASGSEASYEFLLTLDGEKREDLAREGDRIFVPYDIADGPHEIQLYDTTGAVQLGTIAFTIQP